MDDKALNQAVKDGWITKKQREKIASRAYLTWLVRTNKAKKHKPKPYNSMMNRMYGPS